MANVKVFNMQGAAVGEIALSDEVFGVEPHIPAMHAVVRAYMNAQRQGTQSALTRTEVRGGGRKIYRQKGTGNARHHGRRAPQFTHGGVVFAPKPRSYRISVPRKVRRLAMKSAYDIIKKPVLTEKSYADMADKKYTFEVDIRANKTEIKQALEKVFEGVKVDSVNTMRTIGKIKRQGRFSGRTPEVKKAIITLKKDSKPIPFFEGMESEEE